MADACPPDIRGSVAFSMQEWRWMMGQEWCTVTDRVWLGHVGSVWLWLALASSVSIPRKQMLSECWSIETHGHPKRSIYLTRANLGIRHFANVMQCAPKTCNWFHLRNLQSVLWHISAWIVISPIVTHVAASSSVKAIPFSICRHDGFHHGSLAESTHKLEKMQKQRHEWH